MDIISFLFTAGTNLAMRILAAVTITCIGLLIIRIVMKILNRALERSKLEKAAHTLIRTLARTVMLILLTLIVASSLGIDVTGIVALASVVTLALSLALQNMLSNVIGGFTLLYTHPFHSGDYVEIAGQSGTVQEISMTYTKLTTPDNKMVSIPNSAVVASEIVNYTSQGTRRAQIDVSASYNTPAQLVIDTLIGATAVAPVLEEPAAPFAALTSYGDSAIHYTLRFWVKGDDYWDAVFAVNKQIKLDFDAKGVEMTYPHLNVHLDK